jgi:hypothetical protein
MSLIVPPWVTAYRKVLVVSAVALASGAAGWTINGWRKGKELSELQLAHSQAEVRRTVAVGVEWQQATKGALDSLTQARELLQRERAKNAARQVALQAAQPKGEEWACRDKPLPEPYLQQFRSVDIPVGDKTP